MMMVMAMMVNDDDDADDGEYADVIYTFFVFCFGDIVGCGPLQEAHHHMSPKLRMKSSR